MKSELILSISVSPSLLTFSHPVVVQPPFHFLQRGIWKELWSPFSHKKDKCLPPRTTLISKRHWEQGALWVSLRQCPLMSFSKYLYIYILLSPSVIKVRKKTLFCWPSNPRYYLLIWCPDFIITPCQVRTCHVFIWIFACVVWQLQFFINSQQCFPGILSLW